MGRRRALPEDVGPVQSFPWPPWATQARWEAWWQAGTDPWADPVGCRDHTGGMPLRRTKIMISIDFRDSELGRRSAGLQESPLKH